MTPLIAIIAFTLLGVFVLLVAGLLLFTYQMARRLLRPERRPMALSPADVNLAMSVIRIPSSRGALAAWYLPASNGCTLVCCHGINDNSGQWLPQIARLHARGGYGALLFDFAGHGQSEGSQVTYGIRERHDVTAAIEYLRQRGDVDMDHLAILGYSLGAITAVLAAVEHPDLRAVVIESGFSDLYHDIAKLFTRYTGLPAFLFAHLVIFWGQRIAHVRLSEFGQRRLSAALRHAPCSLSRTCAMDWPMSHTMANSSIRRRASQRNSGRSPRRPMSTPLGSSLRHGSTMWAPSSIRISSFPSGNLATNRTEVAQASTQALHVGR